MPKIELGDAPIQDHYRRQMEVIAKTLDEFLNGGLRGANRQTGFVLLVFPFGEHDGARCNFMSNGADRRDLISLFREMAARFEGQAEARGTG